MLWEYRYAKSTVFESARLVALRMRILARLFNTRRGTMATETVVNSLGKALQDDKKPGEEQVLQFKDFVWDQFIKYISSAILALTILNLSVEFLRGGGVLCFPPLNTKSVGFS